MKLGNSNGNNKGKKYFVRGRDDQDMDVVYAEKAEEFARWFAQNYKSTKRQLLNRRSYDDDAFSDTYLRVYEIILFTGRKINDYASYFHRAYYTNFIQDKTKENRYCELFVNYDVEDDNDSDYFEEIEAKSTSLSSDVMNYVYDSYDVGEFEVFKMYMNLKPAVNYHSLARMTGSKYYVIQRMISKIVQDVRDNAQFVMRRREVAVNS